MAKSHTIRFLLDVPGETGARFNKKVVQADDEDGALAAFHDWFEGCNKFPKGASYDIQEIVPEGKSEGFRLELIDTIAVPQWLYDAYIMGDEYSGHLTMTEQEKLADFKAQFDKYHLDNHDEEAQYCGTNEFDGMGGLCYDVDVYKRSNDEKCGAPAGGAKFTDGNEAKGDDMDFSVYYEQFKEEAKKLLSEDLWDKAYAGSDVKGFAHDLSVEGFNPKEAAEAFAEMVQEMAAEGAFGEARCEGMDGDWRLEYEDVFGNKKIEKDFDTEGQAWLRYNELENRTHGALADILWVKEPVQTHLADECGSSAASLGTIPNGGSQVKDEEVKYCINCGKVCGEGSERHGPYDFCSQACYLDFIEHEEIPEGKKAESEGKDEFLKDALYRINFDGDEEVVAKLVKNGEDFSLVALMPDGKAKAVKTADLFSVVDYCKELLDMDTEDAIIVIENA